MLRTKIHVYRQTSLDLQMKMCVEENAVKERISIEKRDKISERKTTFYQGEEIKQKDTQSLTLRMCSGC